MDNLVKNPEVNSLYGYDDSSSSNMDLYGGAHVPMITVQRQLHSSSLLKWCTLMSHPALAPPLAGTCGAPSHPHSMH